MYMILPKGFSLEDMEMLCRWDRVRLTRGLSLFRGVSEELLYFDWNDACIVGVEGFEVCFSPAYPP